MHPLERSVLHRPLHLVEERFMSRCVVVVCLLLLRVRLVRCYRLRLDWRMAAGLVVVPVQMVNLLANRLTGSSTGMKNKLVLLGRDLFGLLRASGNHYVR